MKLNSQFLLIILAGFFAIFILIFVVFYSFIVFNTTPTFFHFEILLSAIVVISFLVIWRVQHVLKHHIFKPLNELSEVIKRYGENDLFARAEILNHEIDTVCQTFNEMADNLTRQREQEFYLLQRNALAIEMACDGICILNPQGYLVEANTAFYKMLGFEPQEIENTHFSFWDFNLLNKNGVPQVREHLFEKRYCCKNKNIIDVEISSATMELNGEKHIWYSVRDITQRKHTEQSLLQLAYAIEQSPITVMITDLNGTIEYVNENFTKNTGYTRSEAIGKKASLIRSNKVSQETYEQLWLALINGQSWRGELVNRRKDNSEYTDLALITPIRQSENVTHYLSIQEDITQLKIVQANLALTHAELEQFARIATHHLQEPTRRIVSFVQLLKNQLALFSIPYEAKTTLEFIEKSALRQKSLIHDIQLYLTASEPRGDLEKVDVNRIIGYILKNQIICSMSEHTKIEYSHLPKVYLDSPRVHDIFAILLDNALRYNQQNAKSLVIEISGQEIADRVLFRFSDNGIGIPSEYRTRVFLVFERLKVTDNPFSTGIGLSIAKQIVEHCGGSIKLEETQGGGTTVLFDLPRA